MNYKYMAIALLLVVCSVGVNASITGWYLSGAPGEATVLAPGQQANYQVSFVAPYNISSDYSGGVAFYRWCGFGLMANDSTVVVGDQMSECLNDYGNIITVNMPSDVRKSYSMVALMVETKKVYSPSGWITEYEDRIIYNESYQITLGDVSAPPALSAPSLGSFFASIWGWLSGLFNW